MLLFDLTFLVLHTLSTTLEPTHIYTLFILHSSLCQLNVSPLGTNSSHYNEPHMSMSFGKSPPPGRKIPYHRFPYRLENTKRKDLENPFPLFKRKPEIWTAPKNSEEKVSAKNVQNMPSFYTQGERARKKVASSNVLIFLPPALRAPKGREKEGEGGPCVVVYPFPRRREAQSAGLPDVLAQMPFGRSMHPDVEGEVTSL
ncbi:hypothetical protein M8J75_004178 [Diaphorina citri]|nr:hypothetical protein M8J75_004178 [Diaphorina citri]